MTSVAQRTRRKVGSFTKPDVAFEYLTWTDNIKRSLAVSLKLDRESTTCLDRSRKTQAIDLGERAIHRRDSQDRKENHESHIEPPKL